MGLDWTKTMSVVLANTKKASRLTWQVPRLARWVDLADLCVAMPWIQVNFRYQSHIIELYIIPQLSEYHNGMYSENAINQLTSKLSLSSDSPIISSIIPSRSEVLPCSKHFSTTLDAYLCWLICTTFPFNLLMIWLLSWGFPLSKTCCK